MTLTQLRQQCLLCTACPLHETRTSTVFGGGNPNADLLFIGEAPGKQEDLKGEPFIGQAGKMLDLYLDAFDFSREEIFITNIVKCRPPNNRDPQQEEEQACLPYLEQQIGLIRPKLMVCLGRIAAMKLIKPDFKITAEHGIWFERDGIPIMATLHPAALLRDPNKKPDSFEDFKNIRSLYDKLVSA